MTDSLIAEGHVKIRQGKKWKSRWVVLRKPSPVAGRMALEMFLSSLETFRATHDQENCLQLSVYNNRLDRCQGLKERNSVTLEKICGVEMGVACEGVAHSLSILCVNQVTFLGFDSRDALLAWDQRLRYCLGEVHSFSVSVPPGSKLLTGPATLYLCNSLVVLARHLPPVIIGQWDLLDLRRYGPVPGGFVFEGGTRCGYWAGVFFLSCAEGEQISFLFDCILRGVSPSRGVIRPLLPDPSTTPASVEEHLNHETEELEKRLMLLSHFSHSNTVSSSSSGTSVTGGDHSISDTSDIGPLDSSIHCHPVLRMGPTTPSPADSSCISKSKINISPGEEEMPTVHPEGGVRSLHMRRLCEIGWQSSSDSGIATGSHSSYSGSFLLSTGSWDMLGSGEDFGSILSLPLHSSPAHNPCTCRPCPGHEYQIPTSLRYLYDTPKSLLNPTRPLDTPTSPVPKQPIKDAPRQTALSHAQLSLEEHRGETVPPSHAHFLNPAPPLKALLTACPVCGGLKETLLPETGLLSACAVPGGQSDSCLTDMMDHSTNEELRVGLTTTSATWSPNHNAGKLSWDQSQRTNETPQKKGPQNYINNFSELLGLYWQDESSDVKNRQCPVYEAMHSVVGPSLIWSPAVSDSKRSSAVQKNSSSTIYENCLQCERGEERCGSAPGAHAVPQKTSKTEWRSRDRADLSHCPQEETETAESQLTQKPSDFLPQVVLSDDVNVEEDKRQRSREEWPHTDPAFDIMDSEKSLASEESSSSKFIVSLDQSHLCETEVAGQKMGPDRLIEDTGTYVNIPISATGRKQLHCLGLECRTASQYEERPPGNTAIVTLLPQKHHEVPTQHAQGQEEEQRRRGEPTHQ